MPRVFEFRKGTSAGKKQGELLPHFPCVVNPRPDDDLNKRMCIQCTATNGDRRIIKVLAETKKEGWIIEELASKKKRRTTTVFVEVKEYNKILSVPGAKGYKLAPGVTKKFIVEVLGKYVLLHAGMQPTKHGNPRYDRVVQQSNTTKKKQRCRNNSCYDDTYCKKHLQQILNLDIRQSEMLTSKGIQGNGLFVEYPTPAKYVNQLRLYGLERYLRFRDYNSDEINIAEWLAYGEYYASLAVPRRIQDMYDLNESRRMVFNEQMKSRPQRGERLGFPEEPIGPPSPSYEEIHIFQRGDRIIDYHGEKLTQEEVDKRYDYENENGERVEPTAPFTLASIDGACSRNAGAYANAFGPGPTKKDGSPVFTKKLSKHDKPNDPRFVLGGNLYNNGFGTKKDRKDGSKYLTLLGGSKHTDNYGWNGEEILYSYGVAANHGGDKEKDDYWEGMSEYYGTWSESYKKLS